MGEERSKQVFVYILTSAIIAFLAISGVIAYIYFSTSDLSICFSCFIPVALLIFIVYWIWLNRQKKNE